MTNYYSRIKDIYIQLHNYEFFHGPSDYNTDDSTHLPRTELVKKLKSYFDSKIFFSGVYLVTGFRGIGKTSLVRKTLIDAFGKRNEKEKRRIFRVKLFFSSVVFLFLNYIQNIFELFTRHCNSWDAWVLRLKETTLSVDFVVLLIIEIFMAIIIWVIIDTFHYRTISLKEKKAREHRIIELSLSQDNLNEFDVLRNIAWGVYDEYKESLSSSRFLTRVMLFGFWIVLGFWVAKIVLDYSDFPAIPINPVTLEKLKIDISSFNTTETSRYLDLSKIVEKLLHWQLTSLILTFTVLCLSLILVYYVGKWSMNNIHKLGFITHRYVLKRLSKLNDRINSSLIEDKRLSFKQFEFKVDFGGKAKSYDKADSKEIEYELTQIFKLANKVHGGFSKRRFVIVFDELDKVELGRGVSETGKSDSSIESKQNGSTGTDYYNFDPERRRREKIADLLGGLKHFLTNAHAKFIFIAGTEMFDASLADSSERDSYFGSIFHDVIYVPGFYTDEDHRTSDIKAMTEKYLCQFLIPYHEQKREGIDGKFELSLKGYSHYLMKHALFKDNAKPEGSKLWENPSKKPSEKSRHDNTDHNGISHKMIINKTMFTLYNFIIFLTARSNGSPKKLSKLIEEHLILDPNLKNDKRNKPYYVIEDGMTRSDRCSSAREKLEKFNEKKANKALKSLEYCHQVIMLIWSFLKKEIDVKKDALTFWLRIRKNRTQVGRYLYFEELDQYKFGFNTYLFNPFYFTHSIYLTNHSDKLLVASSFLLNHLYKFHSLAFSRHSLELTPEVVSYSKVPELREFMEGLFNTISNKHIREISSGLNTHRFQHRIFSEIEFLSRILQSESAIYNFTLDESLPLKRFYTKKLKELASTYEHYNSGPETRNPFAISHINFLLADLHFFDKEYDDSMTYFHSGLKYLAHLEHHTINSFTQYVTNLMKLGLVYEKMKQYERAYGVYSRINEQLHKFLEKKGFWSDGQIDRTGHREGYIYFSTFLISPVVAKFALFEKGGSNGITPQDYEKIVVSIDSIYDKIPMYREENFLNVRELNHKIGNIFYYKNSNLLCQKGDFGWTDDELMRSFFLNCSIAYTENHHYPIDALFVYLNNLKVVLSETGYLETDECGDLENVLMAAGKISVSQHQKTDKHIYLSKKHHIKIANYLSKLGDTFLCFENESITYEAKSIYDFTNNIARFDSGKGGNYARLEGKTHYPIFLAMFCYKASINLVSKDSPILASFRLMKILFVVKDNLAMKIDGKNKVKNLDSIKLEYLELLEKGLVKPILELMHEANEGTRRLSIQQFKINADVPFYKSMRNIYPNDSNSDQLSSSFKELLPLILDGSSNSAETKEVIIAFSEIKLKLLGLNAGINNPTNGFNNINNQFNRMWELWHKMHLNQRVWKEEIEHDSICLSSFTKNFFYKYFDDQEFVKHTSNRNISELSEGDKELLSKMMIEDNSEYLSGEDEISAKGLLEIDFNKLSSSQKTFIIKILKNRSSDLTSINQKYLEGRDISKLKPKRLKILEKTLFKFRSLISQELSSLNNPLSGINHELKNLLSMHYHQLLCNQKPLAADIFKDRKNLSIGEQSVFLDILIRLKDLGKLKREEVIITTNFLKNDFKGLVRAEKAELFDLLSNNKSLIKDKKDQFLIDEIIKSNTLINEKKRAFRKTLETLINLKRLNDHDLDILRGTSEIDFKNISEDQEKELINIFEENLFLVKKKENMEVAKNIKRIKKGNKEKLRKVLETFISLKRLSNMEVVFLRKTLDRNFKNTNGMVLGTLKEIVSKHVLDLKGNQKTLANSILNDTKKLTLEEQALLNGINERLEYIKEIELKEINDIVGLGTNSTNEKELKALLLNNSCGLSENQKRNLSKVLIIDSIYCLTEIIKSHKVFGISYVHNHTTLAVAHQRLGEWCERLDTFVSDNSNETDKEGKVIHTEILKELNLLIHEESTTYLRGKYHFQQAQEHFDAAIRMHSGGKEYQNQIERMFFSEDDFDDESQHFSAAMERMKLNSGYLNTQIKIIKKKLDMDSEIHNWKNFIFQ